MSFLDTLIYGVRDVLNDLTPLTRFSRIWFRNNMTVTVDTVNKRWIVDATGGGGGGPPAGTGVVHAAASAFTTVGPVVLTSEVSGVLPIANGGTALSSLGTALQVLRVNAGATALEYATPSGGSTPTGTGVPSIVAGVQQAAAVKITDALVDAAAAISGSKISPDFAAQTVKTTGHIELGAAPVASAGLIRASNTTPQVMLAGRNAGNTQDMNCVAESGGNLFFGNTNWSNSVIQSYAGGYVAFSSGGTYTLMQESGFIRILGAQKGWSASSQPMTKGRATITVTGALTLSAAEYENPIIRFIGTPGAAFVASFPAGTGTTSPYFYITNDTNKQVTCQVVAGGAGIVVLSGKSAIIWYDGTDYVGVTA